MNLVHVHLWLNHLPILGTMIALAIFALSLVVDHDEMKQAGLALFAFIALFAIPAYMSGNAAGEVIKNNADASMELIQAHQGSALVAFIFIELTGAVSLFGLFRFSRTQKNPWMERPGKVTLFVVLALAIATSGLMAVAGNTGGEIRHAEIASGPGPTSAIGNLGFGLAVVGPAFCDRFVDVGLADSGRSAFHRPDSDHRRLWSAQHPDTGISQTIADSSAPQVHSLGNRRVCDQYRYRIALLYGHAGFLHAERRLSDQDVRYYACRSESAAVLLHQRLPVCRTYWSW